VQDFLRLTSRPSTSLSRSFSIGGRTRHTDFYRKSWTAGEQERTTGNPSFLLQKAQTYAVQNKGIIIEDRSAGTMPAIGRHTSCPLAPWHSLQAERSVVPRLCSAVSRSGRVTGAQGHPVRWEETVVPFVQCSIGGYSRKLQPIWKVDHRDRDTWLYRECDLCHSSDVEGQIICDRCCSERESELPPIQLIDLNIKSCSEDRRSHRLPLVRSSRWNSEPRRNCVRYLRRVDPRRCFGPECTRSWLPSQSLGHNTHP
jgi:hypothetical protein